MDISSVASGSVATAQGGTRAVVQAESPVSEAAQPNISTQAPSPEQVAQAVKQVNDGFAQQGQNLYASIERDKASGINVVKIVDKTTHEIVGQFPSKAIIALADSIDQFKQGTGRLMNVTA